MKFVYCRFEHNINAAQRFRLEIPFKDKDVKWIHFRGNIFLRWLKEEYFYLKYLKKSSTLIYNRWPTSFGFSIVLFFKQSEVILDLDDLIDRNEFGRNIRLKFLFRVNKFRANKIWCGNEFLLIHSRSTKSSLVRTSIPNELVCSDFRLRGDKIVFGWTGQKSTLFYLERIVPVLDMLYREFDFSLLYMSDEPSEILASRSYSQHIYWSDKNESDLFKKISIGLMPLDSDDWAEGKCAFKLLQYLENGIPSVASKTMINSQISYLFYPDSVVIVDDAIGWISTLKGLLENIIVMKKPQPCSHFQTKETYKNLL